MATPALNAEEFQYEDSGILLNGDVGIPFTDLTKISGLDAVDVRQSSHDREGVDGGYLDAEFEGMRTIILEGILYASTTGFESVVDDYKANFAPSRVARPLYLGTDAGVRVVFGKSLGFRYDKDSLRRLGQTAFQIQIICEDPRIYSPDIVSDTVVLGSTLVTGRGYDKAYVYGYGPESTGNNVTLTLGGNRKQPGILQIYGPITNPAVNFVNLSTTMYFNLAIDAGDFLEINLGTRTVKLNGEQGRRNKLIMFGNWPLLSPGDNTLSIIGSATLAGSTKLTLSAYQAAWR